MGIDIFYQAMPPNCRLFERAQIEPEFGSGLDLLKVYASKSEEEINKHDPDGHYIDFIREVQRAAREFPGTENRNLALGRSRTFRLSGKRRLIAREEFATTKNCRFIRAKQLETSSLK